MVTPYKPLKVTGFETGLVQSRENFILPADAFPVLENMFVWRERIKRKQGCQLLGRLRRMEQDIPIVSAASPWSFDVLSVTGFVANADNASPGVITTTYPHGMSGSFPIFITDIVGAVGYNAQVHGAAFFCTVTGPSTFNVNADASGYGTYISGGRFFAGYPLTSSSEPDATLEPGSFNMNIGGVVFVDQGDGTITSTTPGNSGTVNYTTGSIVITTTQAASTNTTFGYNYFPNLPVMGINDRELNNINSEQTIVFDTRYAYNYSTGFEEFIPGTSWFGSDSDFFWSTNYWVGDGNKKIFWVTNDSSTSPDPIRYTNGTTWVDFSPTINAAGDKLEQCLAILPFRGRLLVFNTFEGANFATSIAYPQRIRWAAIGNPFSDVAAGVVSVVNANAWRDDIRGQGGFLDIPTSESIVAVGFVRDNLVIYCERSTWQLRYTGRSVSPFQIEKVNSELGAESTFSAVQFDTSLVGIGDKGIVQCDSFKSERIDIKIPDLVFQFNNQNAGPSRVHGIRDFVQRIAYWTYPYLPDSGVSVTYPNRRLVYNYENDSWAIFTDSYTTLGTFQPTSSRKWRDSNFSWRSANFSWVNRPALIPSIIGGNQQGFVEYLDDLGSGVTNDVSLFIQDITGNVTTPTVITSPNHNLQTGTIIQLRDLPATDPFYSLNNGIFEVDVVDINSFKLLKYNSSTGAFSSPQVNPSGTFIGVGNISIRDNFRVVSKKFNFMDEGQNIQIGYIDVLMDATPDGAISLKMYLNYNDSQASNTLPQNIQPATGQPDPFFNIVVPTSASALNGVVGSKYPQRVFCATRGNFLTIEWTLSNAQMNGVEQENDVQIDGQVIWQRPAGRFSQ